MPRELGYAEADPAADVDGLDAADKIAILATLAFGGSVDRAAVPTDGISGLQGCLLYTSPSPRDLSTSRMPSSA